MTNRERMIQDFVEMSSEKLAETIRQFSQDIIGENLGEMICDDCHAEHGGRCVYFDNVHEGCPSSMAKWLDKECKREHLIL